MTAKRNILLSCALFMGCCAGVASAAAETRTIQQAQHERPRPCNAKRDHCYQVPEIDSTKGVQAIAIVTAMLLLAAERARRRRHGEPESVVAPS